ncbi:cytochrome c biogenesis protein ResB [Fodinisporobacter ferrooxydans]|uniref:Cytochrome c biogenesis protein ResB n=1 Tax=Fodinisporobacter ferrooxydans TaxID=2901836 RepID=A0ABY4CHB5_9BACL|nr:cytochrome c biogenesis protein ResB [Alicyclobacillaceae bacterium MYW30-H2]
MKEVKVSQHSSQQIHRGRKRNQKTLLDGIWGFFVSVRVAIVIIVIIAVSSVIGTVIPQENAIPSSDPANYYAAKYGTIGKIVYQFGFTNMYTSWWFLTLLLLLATSLVICSWERIVPLYKSLQHQVVQKSVLWLQQRKIYVQISEQLPFSDACEGVPESAGTNSAFTKLMKTLSQKRYKLKTDGDSFLAEKGRFSRFGPYILHVGLLIVIAGAFSRVIPGWYFDTMLAIPEGQTVQVPHTNFSIRNDKFTIHYYTDGRPSLYETKVSIVRNQKIVKTANIQVNHALEFDHLQFLQSSFEDPYFETATITFSKPGSKQILGSFPVDFAHPKFAYHSGAYTIHVVNYYPEFKMENNQPTTESNVPRKPTFLFQVEGPGIAKPSPQAFFAFFPILSHLEKGTPVEFMIRDIVKNQPTILRVHKDLGVPIVYFGCVIIVLGLILSFYFQHRLIWGRREEGVLHIGAQTNKNWLGLSRELETVISGQLGLPMGEGGSIVVKRK